MNHLETLTTEWLDYNGYFTRSTIRVGKRALGGWNGELDVIGFHAETRHFVHIECSTDAWNWEKRETTFSRKFQMGRDYARSHFAGMNVPEELDQVVVHGYVRAIESHRLVGGGRLMSSGELAAEIINGVPRNSAKGAVPENFPLMRTLQLAVMAGAKIDPPASALIPTRAPA